ncbi:hypothetical protein [Prescottella agglutinans]|nr:hypothetical protein [Prescottella agglutinans]
MPCTALAIDIGTTTVTATVRDHHGRVANVSVDGTTTPSSYLVVDRGLPRPARPDDPLTMQQLGSIVDRLDVPSTVINGVSWSADTLLGILLNPVIAAAEKLLGQFPERIVLVVPFWWDQERKLRLQMAVHAALHRPSVIVPSDKAIAYAVPTPAVGEHRIAIDCCASTLAAVVLGGGERGTRVVASATTESGGDIFDRVLLADALIGVGHQELALDSRWAFAGVPRVRAGREALANYDQVRIMLPQPVGQITLSSAAVDATGSEYFTRAFGALFADLDATGRAAGDARSRSLLLHGGLAYDPAVSAAARPLSAAGAQVLPQPQHLLCRGALAFDAADRDSTADPDPVPELLAEPESVDEVRGTGRGWSKRTLAVYGGVGTLVVALAVGGGLALSSAMTGVSDVRDADLPAIAAAVLPGQSSISGTSLKTWSDGGDRDDPTTRSLSGKRLETLACGGSQPATGAEADGLRWEASRTFVSDGDKDTTTSWDAFDSSASENVVVTAAIVSRENRDSVWQEINRTNQRCPSTKDDLVRTIVVIPQDGSDPGPPTYSESLSAGQTPTTSPKSAETATRGAGQGGIMMSTHRQAWRGLIPASVAGSGKDMNVTCVLDVDGIVLRRACATATTSAKADKLAQSAVAAFNPTPEKAR